MFRSALGSLLVLVSAATASDARIRHAGRALDVHRTSNFLSVLDHDGDLSAGWLDVLPALATACKFRIDNQQLTSRLIDLSYESRNVSYTRSLYTTLYEIEKRRANNVFVRAWTARFDGRQKEACDTAEALWGDTGQQFPGVLKREVVNDGASGLPPANCR